MILPPRVGLTESTVSHHLTQLRKAGMVSLGPPRHERLPPSPAQTPSAALWVVLDPNCCT